MMNNLPQSPLTMEIQPLVIAIENQMRTNTPMILVVDGDCGAGKSTLAQHLSTLFDASIIPVDDFFVPFAIRTDERMRSPGSNVHWERFLLEILQPLHEKSDFTYQAYRCQSNSYVEKSVKMRKLIIVEGSYSHHPELSESYKKLNALRCFISVDEETQHARLKERNPQLYQRFVDEWIPLEKNYHQAYDIINKADLIINNLPQK